jgi:hypothetical protein
MVYRRSVARPPMTFAGPGLQKLQRPRGTIGRTRLVNKLLTKCPCPGSEDTSTYVIFVTG